MSPSVAIAFSLVLSVFVGCERQAPPEDIRGVFGVFYGGQIQELSAISWERGKEPVLGFRLECAAPSALPRQVRYEIVRPGPLGRRVTEMGEARIGTGETSYDFRVEVPPDMPLGTVNVRVEVEGRAVIDRAVHLR